MGGGGEGYYKLLYKIKWKFCVERFFFLFSFSFRGEGDLSRSHYQINSTVLVAQFPDAPRKSREEDRKDVKKENYATDNAKKRKKEGQGEVMFAFRFWGILSFLFSEVFVFYSFIFPFPFTYFFLWFAFFIFFDFQISIFSFLFTMFFLIE